LASLVVDLDTSAAGLNADRAAAAGKIAAGAKPRRGRVSG
jgi:hypothetical protein